MLNFHSYDWERVLLSMAYEAFHSHRAEGVAIAYDSKFLNQAYARCDAITQTHSRSFSMASRLLPAPRRRAIRALYAFCRTTDDIVDHPSGNTQAALQIWRKHALSWNPPDDDAVAVAWADTRAQYQIPKRYAEQLIDGVARDLTQTRYQTFEELAGYCYGVASTVGLMSMHIIGFHSDAAIPYAVKLGVALQLTNILRDIKEDWQRGRLYLPQSELEDFNITEQDIDCGLITANWRKFMKFQIARARRLYTEAWPGIDLLAPEGRFAIAAAADFYRAILADIEAHDYDVFSRRAHLTKWGKLRRLPALWWRINVNKSFNSPLYLAAPFQFQ